ncbi:MAG: hypothetical protein OXU81_04060 [Gammaproteobacteria bacterium]|nr:hypothetical protein [Gammaproteobacteria bacterium]
MTRTQVLQEIRTEDRYKVHRMFRTRVDGESAGGILTPQVNSAAEDNGMSLAERLDAIREAGAKRVPAEKRAVMGAATQALRDAGISDGFIKVGDSLPEFALDNAHGQVVQSADLLNRSVVVLTVFRGHW